ncbi:ATP-dependent Lon protease, partial [Rhizobium ruizarguesonis]
EEEEYPQFYHTKGTDSGDARENTLLDFPVAPPSKDGAAPVTVTAHPAAQSSIALAEGHFVYAENRKGVSYEKLFGPYVDGAS